LATSFPAEIRCTQNVHLSTTPTARTDTSGFNATSRGPVKHWISKVEEPDIIRTRIRAVPRADAPVVDLRVKAFFRVMTRIGRAHRLARRRIALLAHHRPELHADVGELALVVPLDADPVHCAPARRLVGPDRRDIVLSMAGGHARTAASALVQINGHAPSVCHQLSTLSYQLSAISYRTSRSCGFSYFSPANKIRLPSASAARAILTRVAAHASDPVSVSVIGARMLTGFAPRLLA